MLQLNKTRIAPTPSGYLHLGNILSFAITAALARKTGAKILLRIDDFDRERTNKIYVQDIFDTLNFLEIPWDEGPRNMNEYEREYSQVHRLDMHQKAVLELKNNGYLFACTCTRSQVVHGEDSVYPGTCIDKHIPFDMGNVSWRLRTDSTKQLEVRTYPATIVQATLPAPMSNFIVRKKDGFPAYQLISVVDDLYYGVDLVVRGADLWSSTLAQLYLSSLLDIDEFKKTTFYHHPLLMGDDGHKLSKSAGATSVHYCREEGQKPAEIYDAIAGLLGITTPITNWEDLIANMSI